MLTIRKEQIIAFEDQSIKSFEDDTVQHLKSFTPKQFEIIGELSIRKIIKLGIEKAEKCKFTMQGPIRFYIEMMFMFGSDFDTDPQYPWVREILNIESGYNQMERADKLHERMTDYIEKAVGTEGEFEKAALQKASKLQFKDLLGLNSENPDGIVNELKRIYPQKCDYLGDVLLNKLHKYSYLYAKNNSLLDYGGISVLFALMFSFGHGCITDLQFPWISRTLETKSNINTEEISNKLFSKMMIYFNNVVNSTR